MHTAIDFAIKRVRAFADEREWKKSRFAREAGLPDTTLRHFDKGERWNPSAVVIRRLESIIPDNFMPPPKCKSNGRNGRNGKRGK